MRLSVIIANYNYRDFVGDAIASALAIDWPDLEVIVVDDASTDDSKSVIEGFAGRVAAYYRPKSHQLGAHIFGFQQSTGDVVILLDADDLLEPEIMQEIVKVWRPGVSKVQYRMNPIRADGTQLGTGLPQFPPTEDAAKLRRVFLRTMTYTTPPGSGNAYSRAFMQEAYALTPVTMRWSDDVLLTLAPIMGEVVTIRKPLARYRIHSANDGAMGSLDAVKLRNRLQQDIEKARLFKAVCEQLRLRVPSDPLLRSQSHLQYRFASYIVEPAAHPFPEDRISKLFYRLGSSTITFSQMRARDRAILLAWAIACVVSPQQFRRKFVAWRFAAISRPAAIGHLLGVLSSIRSTRLPDRALGKAKPMKTSEFITRNG